MLKKSLLTVMTTGAILAIGGYGLQAQMPMGDRPMPPEAGQNHRGPGGGGQPGGPGMMGMGCDDPSMLPPGMDRLNLSEEQQQAITTIQTDFCNDTATLRDEMQAGHEAMRDVMSSDASREELEQQHDEMRSIHEQLHDRAFTMMLDIRDVLTPEQRRQLAESMPGEGMGRPEDGQGQPPMMGPGMSRGMGRGQAGR